MAAEAGASDINGTTDFDRTNYYETLPSNQLDLALWLESDRMGFLLETLDGPKLANQGDVVRNERRQSIENTPYGLPEEAMIQALYPAPHPYHGNVIGSHADIEALSVKIPPALNELVQDITDYKRGIIYQEFADAVDLFTSVDRAVRDYVNKAVVRYAYDYAARQPTTETERWLLLPYRARVDEMTSALEREAQTLGINQKLLTLGSAVQPVELHCVPDNFSIPESKKFAAYIFDDEAGTDSSGALGKLHIVAAFGNITDLQVRRHLGNFEAAEVYSDDWGLYACVPGSGMQCVYVPRCVSSLVMQSKLSGAISWLNARDADIKLLATRRKQILNLISGAAPAKVRRAGSGQG